MKKIILALAAVAALAACSKTEAEYEQTAEIALTPVTKNITKTMTGINPDGTANNVFPDTESFNVWAWYKQLGNNTTIENWQKDQTMNQWYIAEKTFARKTDGTSWAGTPNAYYWPKLGSLMFAGYYPTSLAGNVSYSFENHQMSDDGTTVETPGLNQMIFDGIYQSSVLASGYSEDIMYFNMTEKSVNSGPVSVVFKHALSWLTVNVKKSTESPKIVIDEIKFTGINNKGTGTVNGTNIISWVTNGTVEETVVGNNVQLTTSMTKLMEPLIIPQTMEGNLVITYTVYSSDTEKFTETYTAALSTLKTGLDTWEPAKHYVYNIEIGTTEILIDPTVGGWENVEVPVAI